MIIDSHAHFVPASLMDDFRRRRSDFPSVEITEKGDSLSFAFAGHNPTRPLGAFLINAEKRLAWMDENGIDVQTPGGWVDIFGNEIPGSEGADWCRMMNEHMIRPENTHGGRFMPLCTLPIQDGEQAATVMREAHAMGFKGAMIGTQPKGRSGNLDDPDLDPFWETADELGFILNIHPIFESCDQRTRDYGMPNGVWRVADSMIATARIMYSGHVEKYKNAKIVIGIGGAAVPFIIGRLRQNYSLDADNLGDPDVALKMMYFDTVVHEPATLKFVVDMVGADRVLLGSDMPFPIGDKKPREILDKAGLSAEQKQLIETGVATKLLGL